MASDSRPSLPYMVKQVEQVTRASLDELLRPAGVTVLQYTALSVVDRAERITSADLARQSFVRAQSAADLVNALIKRGLITREPDPAHRRRLLISLTDEGRSLLADYAPREAELERRMLADFDAAEREVFRDLLLRARRSLANRAGGQDAASA